MVFFIRDLYITHIGKVLISRLLFSNATLSHCQLLKFLLVPNETRRKSDAARGPT